MYCLKTRFRVIATAICKMDCIRSVYFIKGGELTSQRTQLHGLARTPKLSMIVKKHALSSYRLESSKHRPIPQVRGEPQSVCRFHGALGTVLFEIAIIFTKDPSSSWKSHLSTKANRRMGFARPDVQPNLHPRCKHREMTSWW